MSRFRGSRISNAGLLIGTKYSSLQMILAKLYEMPTNIHPDYYYQTLTAKAVLTEDESEFIEKYEEHVKVSEYLKTLLRLNISLKDIIPLTMLTDDLITENTDSKYINEELNDLIKQRYMETILSES